MPVQSKIRDVSKYVKFKGANGQVQSLKKMAKKFLDKSIQEGEHSSVIDAKAALALYRINEKEWENHSK